MEKIVIKRSKTKLIWAIVGSIIFIICCIVLFLWEENSSLYMKWVYIFWFFFFSFIAWYAYKKLWDDKPALIIDNKWIIDNSSFGSVWFVSWENITEIYIKELDNKQRIITIILQDPSKIISNLKWITKLWALLNNMVYKSPVQLSSVSLECNINELFELLTSRIK